MNKHRADIPSLVDLCLLSYTRGHPYEARNHEMIRRALGDDLACRMRDFKPKIARDVTRHRFRVTLRHRYQNYTYLQRDGRHSVVCRRDETRDTGFEYLSSDSEEASKALEVMTRVHERKELTDLYLVYKKRGFWNENRIRLYDARDSGCSVAKRRFEEQDRSVDEDVREAKKRRLMRYLSRRIDEEGSLDDMYREMEERENDEGGKDEEEESEEDDEEESEDED